mgnify:CR=1 FL=1
MKSKTSSASTLPHELAHRPQRQLPGIYDRASSSIELFEKDTTHGQRKLASTKGSADDPIFKELLDEDVHQGLIDDIELLDEAGDEFDMEKVKRGELTPMFFGSAMTNFGVKPSSKNSCAWLRNRSRENASKAPSTRHRISSRPSSLRSRPT